MRAGRQLANSHVPIVLLLSAVLAVADFQPATPAATSLTAADQPPSTEEQANLAGLVSLSRRGADQDQYAASGGHSQADHQQKQHPSIHEKYSQQTGNRVEASPRQMQATHMQRHLKAHATASEAVPGTATSDSTSHVIPEWRLDLDKFMPAVIKKRHQRGEIFKQKKSDELAENLPRTYAALCLCVRDDQAALWEWIMYHHVVLGVERFYIFENNSTRTSLPMLMPLVQKGVVVYEYFSYLNRHMDATAPHQPDLGSPQRYANHACFARWGRHHEWMGFIDNDEYIVIRGPWPVPKSDYATKYQGWVAPPRGALDLLLSEYEGAGGLAINWVVFGSSGHLNRTKGLLGYYTKCVDHDHIKAIASTFFYAGSEWHPHIHRTEAGTYYVDAEGHTINASRNFQNLPINTSRLALFHYNLRSREDYDDKVVRGEAWGHRPRDKGYFENVDEMVNQQASQFQCNDLDQFKDCFVYRSSGCANGQSVDSLMTSKLAQRAKI